MKRKNGHDPGANRKTHKDHDCDSEELIEDACHGSESAFRRLVECNQEMLFASMMRLLGCREDAEEAVQEAFVRAFSRIEDFKRDAKFSTWIYRIAFNSAISQGRKQRPRVSLDERFEEGGIEPIDDREAGVDAPLFRAEQVQLVHQALDHLSSDHRAILVLREFDELAYEEIGAVLQISSGTVRSRLSRARTQLRGAIESLQSHVSELRSSDK